MQKKKIAIFASGGGSNAQKIIDFFKEHPAIVVSLVVCNKPGAGVITITQKEGIELLLLDKELHNSGKLPALLTEKGIYFIVLAGFLWKIPALLLEAYPRRIINIHPALLPKYGGKGMYGNHVHQAVIEAGEKESGITIHYVDEHYDHGATIFQTTCPISKSDTAESLAQKIHALEHQFFAGIVEKVVLKD